MNEPRYEMGRNTLKLLLAVALLAVVACSSKPPDACQYVDAGLVGFEGGDGVIVATTLFQTAQLVANGDGDDRLAAAIGMMLDGAAEDDRVAYDIGWDRIIEECKW